MTELTVVPMDSITNTEANQQAAERLIADLRKHQIPIFMKDNMHWYPFPGPREWPHPQEEVAPDG